MSTWSLPDKPAGAVRVCCVSDLHGAPPDVPPCDLLLLGGDICPTESHAVPFQLAWLKNTFAGYLDAVPAAAVIGVAGNHDFCFEKRPGDVPTGLRWTYLRDDAATVCGLKIYGSPWQPEFGRWAFNAPPADRAMRWAAIPDDTEILLLHGPPHGIGDGVPRWGADGFEDKSVIEHTGCPHLRRRLDELTQLKLCVFGHIHEGAGVYVGTGVGPWHAVYVNASVRDGDYAVRRRAAVFDIEDGWCAGVGGDFPQAGHRFPRG